MHKKACKGVEMQRGKTAIGLTAKSDNLILKPIKKSHYKEFLKFSTEYDGYQIPLEEFCEMQASKEIAFMQCGKLDLYLFEKQTDNRFEVGEIVGYIQITAEKEGDDCAEIGYFIKNSKRGQGLGKIILKMAIAICGNIEFSRLIAKVEKSNLESIAILKSANFTIEEMPENREYLFAFLNI